MNKEKTKQKEKRVFSKSANVVEIYEDGIILAKVIGESKNDAEAKAARVKWCLNQSAAAYDEQVSRTS